MTSTWVFLFGAAFIVIGVLLVVFRRRLSRLNYSYKPGQGIRQQTDEETVRQSTFTTVAGALLCAGIGIALILVAVGRR